MDSQELTGGSAARQTEEIAMKEKNPYLVFEAGTNNKGAIPVTSGPVSYTHLDVYKRQVYPVFGHWTFLQ